MKEITELKDIQTLALLLLKDVDEFCAQEGITYYLGYGTLLGAIRHGGFIPWDEDMDIWIKREDYQKFVSKFPEWGQKKDLYLNSPRTVRFYNRPHSQVCLAKTLLIQNERNDRFEEGYYIDVFPIDGLPNGVILQWLRIKHLQLLKNICTLSSYSVKQGRKKTLKKQIFLLISLLFNGIDTQKIMIRYENVAALSPCSTSMNLQIIAPANNRGRNMVMEAKDFDSAEFRKFEDLEAAIPCGYKNVLSKLYGDYMTPPPEDQRKPHHDFRLYLKD